MKTNLIYKTNTTIFGCFSLSRPIVRIGGETTDALMLKMSHLFPVSHTVCCMSNQTVLVDCWVGPSAQAGNPIGQLGFRLKRSDVHGGISLIFTLSTVAPLQYVRVVLVDKCVWYVFHINWLSKTPLLLNLLKPIYDNYNQKYIYTHTSNSVISICVLKMCVCVCVCASYPDLCCAVVAGSSGCGPHLRNFGEKPLHLAWAEDE